MSKHAAYLLIQKGYQAISIKGGITSYSKIIDKNLPIL